MADDSNVRSSNGSSAPLKESPVSENPSPSETGTVADPGSGPAAGPPDVEPYDQEGEDDPEDVDAELEAMKKRLKEMEDEANAVKAAGAGGTDAALAGNSRTDKSADGFGVPGVSAESDARSVYVGNVDYAATPEELQAHFADCGTINRVTIMCNKVTGTPKGFAYIEFVDQDAVKNAVILNESPFRGRPLKVTPKRTNIPGVSARGRGGRGRGVYGYRGRGFPRGRPRGRWVPY